MPFISFFAVIGSLLVGLLFVADATLPKSGPLPISNDFHGLPPAWADNPDNPKNKVVSTAPALVPETASDAVRNTESAAAEESKPAAPAAMAQASAQQPAKAEPAPKKKRVAQHKARPRRDDGAQYYAWRRDDMYRPYQYQAQNSYPWRF